MVHPLRKAVRQLFDQLTSLITYKLGEVNQLCTLRYTPKKNDCIYLQKDSNYKVHKRIIPRGQ